MNSNATPPVPYWSSASGAALHCGDVRACLRRLPARSAHCCVTSPPYWGLRDYGNDKSLEIGAEPTPEEYVATMVEVFQEVRRVLRDDGTCWLNLGDSYAHSLRQSGANRAGNKQNTNNGSIRDGFAPNTTGLLEGNIVGIPWRVALALQADGWILRQDIIWYSTNKMPESVTTRCSKAHEYIFLLAKGNGYYYDSVAIEEERESGSGTKNKRDVWVVPTTGYPGAHFAVYSPKLITPCILAGTSEHGCCATCGSPYERVVVKTGGQRAEPDADGRDRSIATNRNGITGSLDGVYPTCETVGWKKVCGCLTEEVVPATVLDPFVGSGTTVATALQLGRHGVGIDLSETYLRENAIPRIEAVISGEKVKRPTVPMRCGNPPPLVRMRGH